MSRLAELVERLGGSEASLRIFDDEESPDLLPYASFIGSRHGGCADLQAVAGVYEWQESPLLFIADAAHIDDSPHLQRIRRRIALRGDTPFIGVVDAGRLAVYSVALDDAPPARSRLSIEVSEEVTLPYLALQRPQPDASRRRWIADLILRLLQDSLSALRDSGLDENDAVSLAGRALFTRFLADRGLIDTTHFQDEDPQYLFDTPSRVEHISIWLDETFNGDFLPLSTSTLTRLPAQACHTLGNIMRRAEAGQLYLGWAERWDYLDFAQIPVGVLSQAYEGYLRAQDPTRQRQQGAFYTPRPIAETLVRGAFHRLRDEGVAHHARVLDPAVGAGVFLVTAYRQLVAEQWLHTGERPNTEVLRNILYEQLVGFDIDEVALRFAALGLYLVAIELDPLPEPVTKLRFDTNLREHVLKKVASHGTTVPGQIGSLGDNVGREHAARYDLVVGNPPWTAAARLPDWDTVVNNVRRIAHERLELDSRSPPLPNEAMDLPFLWRAMEWARPGGQIAMALHARLLFHQGSRMPEARGTLFSALSITSVINGSELRNTNVWPQVTAPFCLLFATNRIPAPGSGFRFLSPHLEPHLNQSGVMRLDPNNAAVVLNSQVAKQPTILKTLFRGTRLDLDLLERIDSQSLPTLDQYWRDNFGSTRGRALQSGNGYQQLRASTTRPLFAEALSGLPELVPDDEHSVVVNTTTLPRFEARFLHRVRRPEIFQAPLVIVRESPPSRFGRISARLAEQNVTFDQSFYGYSTSGHQNAGLLARYLVLLLRSRFVIWYALMVSGKLGFERDTVEKKIVDSTPIVPLEQLDERHREMISSLFNRLTQNPEDEALRELDRWIASLYGLHERDLQTIGDTLDYNLPFAKNRRHAIAPADRAMHETFRSLLVQELSPWMESAHSTISIRFVDDLPIGCPWTFLRIDFDATASETSSLNQNDWLTLIRSANQTGATEIHYHRDDSIWIGRLRETRYWTASQATLLAQRIIWDHGDSLFHWGEA